MNPQTKKSAYKEPWFWMVLGPLLLVIVVSLSMVLVAFRTADDRVKDDYYKEGRMINKRFAEEENAIAMNVRGHLKFDFTTAEVLAEINANALPDELVLMFSHPADASADETLILRRTGEGRYRADLPRDFDGRWYLILATPDKAETTTPEKQAWRVTTEVDFSQNHEAQFSAHL